MKKLSYLTAIALLSSLSAYPQGPPPSHRGGMGFGPMFMGLHQNKLVTGAPYSADVNNSSVQTLADGNTIQRTTTGHVARDSQGRTYSEDVLTGGPLATKGSTTITFISDPVAGYAYVLNAENKTAMRRALKPERATSPSDRVRPDGPRPSPEGSNRVEADLGQQSINGVMAQGKSVTHTFAAGAIGNAQPIVEKSEVWTAPDLQVVVLSKRTDPRTGTSTYTLNNIVRSEPAATLFQVPSDYTITDAPAGHRPPGPPPTE